RAAVLRRSGGAPGVAPANRGLPRSVKGTLANGGVSLAARAGRGLGPSARAARRSSRARAALVDAAARGRAFLGAARGGHEPARRRHLWRARSRIVGAHAG